MPEEYSKPAPWDVLMLVIAIVNAWLLQEMGVHIASIIWAMAAASKVMEIIELPSSPRKGIWSVFWTVCSIGGFIAIIVGACTKGNP